MSQRSTPSLLYHSRLLCMAELELEFYYQNASVADATVHIPLGRSVSKQQLHLWACYLDLASVLLYLIVVIFISLYQQRVLEEVASKTVTVVDYSVQVWDLPKVEVFVMPDAGDMAVLVLPQTTSACQVTYCDLLSGLTAHLPVSSEPEIQRLLVHHIWM